MSEVPTHNHGSSGAVSEEQRVIVSEGHGVVVPLRNYSHQEVAKLSQQDRKILTARIINEFTATLPNVKFPSRTLNELSAHINVNLQDGIDVKHIARGLEIWNDLGYAPSNLPQQILQAQREANGAPMPGTPQPRRATGSERAIAALNIDTSEIDF
jgi:hypothetical protein